MPSIYQTLFGGNPVAPAIPTYLSLSFAVNQVLGWPLESNITAPAVAAWMDCNATAAALTLQLSDARQVGTGYATIFNNIGANTFSVLDAQGNTLLSPASGTAWILVLADNSTLQGTWRTAQLGAGTSTANAASLSGAGLVALTTLLNLNVVTNVQNTNYVAVLGDRAKAIEWTGGVGTLTLPNNATIPAGWFCLVKNGGTGGWTASVTGGPTIDGAATLVLNPQQSCFLVFDGTNFYTVGLGQQLNSIFDFVQISLTGVSGNFVLSGANLNRISYRFIGAPAGNVTVVLPNVVQQYWVDNETTGAFSLTLSAGGTTASITQGNRNIFYCDGVNVVPAVTFGSTGFVNGSAAAPSMFFAASPGTGLYSPGVNQIAISTAGIERASVDVTGHAVLFAPDNATAPTIIINNASSGAGITARITSTFSATAANPLLHLQSTAVNGFALLSLSGNAGVAGTGDLSIFQDGGTLNATVMNRANASLILATNGTTRATWTGAGATTFAAPSGNNAVQLTTATYTIGNATDNPNVNFAGTGIVAFTTSPTAPTPTAGDSSTKLATTAFVATSFAPLASPALTGTPTAPTAAPGTNTTQIATTAFVATSFAPLASPAFTGTPTAPTAAVGTSTTQLATTAFANPNSSLGSSGHAELPGGLIIQWGQATAASGTSPTDINITFPIAFPTACFGVWPVGHRSVAAAGQANLASNFSTSITTTGATITVDNSTGNPSTYSASWLALGN